MPEIPDSVYQPTYGPKTVTENTLDKDWIDEEDYPYYVPRGSPVRTETYTHCQFERASEGEESVPEKKIALLANGCVAYSIEYGCTQHTVRYWVKAPADVLLDWKSIYLPREYRTVVICGETVEANPPTVWLPPGRYEAAPRQASSEREGNSEYLVYRDNFWDLMLPVVMISRCDGVAKYKRVVRIQKYLRPDLAFVGEKTEDFVPETTKEERFHIPGCQEDANYSQLHRAPNPVPKDQR